MKLKPIFGLTGLILLLVLSGCQGQSQATVAAKNDWTLPYGKWGFEFFTPNALPAVVTHVRIVDTAGYVYQFNALDKTEYDPDSTVAWRETFRTSQIPYFNKAKHPPQYMAFCWDSIIDKKVYETSLFFPEAVWQKMMTPASHKARSGDTVWYKTMLFGLAPEGKVKVWLQDVGNYPNYPVPTINLKTVSGDQLSICKDITRSDFSYGYDQDIKDFIKGKTYPYGDW